LQLYVIQTVSELTFNHFALTIFTKNTDISYNNKYF